MGMDWIRRTQEKYRHCRQRNIETLAPAPLFAVAEDEMTLYPCHWLGEEFMLPNGTRLTVFQPGRRAKVAVLHGVQCVAEIRGEAAAEIGSLFGRNSELQNMLTVRIVETGGVDEPFYVAALRLPRAGKKQ
jgi:hypothetical protein